MAIQSSSDPAEIVLPLHVEDGSVERRKLDRNVQVHVHTVSHDHLIDEAVAHETIEIERVVVGRPIEAVPAVREEGDVTVIPVIEEVLVVERRLVLKEEIRLRRVQTTELHRETITLREQTAVVERAEPGASLSVLPSELAPIPTPQTPRNDVNDE
jgi:stress response protein YsnF